MKTGIPEHQFVICRWTPGTPEEEVKLLTKAGVNMIETGFEWINHASQRQIKAASLTYACGGIHIRSIHAPFGEKEDLTSLNKATREHALKSHRLHLERAGVLGAEYLIVHPGHVCEAKDVAKKEARVFEAVAQLLPTAEAMQVVIALENLLPLHPCHQCSTLVKIVKEFNSPWVRICFDSGHAHIVGDELKELRKCRKLIGSYHLHDNDGLRDLHLQPPYGTTHWEKLFHLIHELTPGLPLTVEANGWGGMDYRWMIQELNALISGRCDAPGPGHKAPTRAVCPVCSHLIFSMDGRWVCHCDSKG